MMGIIEQIKKGEGKTIEFKEGLRKVGEMEKAIQIVKESLAIGWSIDVIARITKLSEEEILRIKEKVS
ncbi:MAG: hypothetical protein PHI90_11120 [Clostridia bacterium]|nr:hypothetical protein [Clostridia bacterium]